ncbi:MAG: RNA methyltransferase [Lachnospiraceae bacterium]|nr:RNA methyltransferase [Lachnospiraceae bacterium]
MITANTNPQIKNIIALQKKAKLRREQDLFIVEGIKMFMEAPKERIQAVYVSESFLKDKEQAEILKDIRYECVSDKVFADISDTMTPQGIMALVKQYHYTFDDIMGEGNAPLLMVLEELNDPGNLGTIVRTGEGAGVTGIVLSKGCVDIYNSKVIRATMGSIYRVPFLYVDDINSALEEIKKRCTVYAAYLDEEMNDCYSNDYKKPTAFLVGNEANGLSDEVVKLADKKIIIPMQGKVESLNASVAASILMYEAHRQRRD